MIAAPGFLRARMTPRDGIAVGGSSYVLLSVDGNGFVPLGAFQGEPPARVPLDPGEYRIDVRGDLVKPLSVSFRIDSGSETAVDLPLESGLDRWIEIVEPWQEEDSTRATVVIEDGDGVVLDTIEIALSPVTLSLSAEHRFSKLGLHRLRATTDSGRSGEASFVVLSGGRGTRIAIPVE